LGLRRACDDPGDGDANESITMSFHDLLIGSIVNLIGAASRCAH
jgi:hypothetical protein